MFCGAGPALRKCGWVGRVEGINRGQRVREGIVGVLRAWSVWDGEECEGERERERGRCYSNSCLVHTERSAGVPSEIGYCPPLSSFSTPSPYSSTPPPLILSLILPIREGNCLPHFPPQFHVPTFYFNFPCYYWVILWRFC